MSELSATTNDQKDFASLYHEYYDLVFRLVMRLTSDREEAEDIAQTTFVRFFRLMKRKIKINDDQAYLARIAINLCNDRWKRKGKENAVSYDDDKTREAMDRQTAQSDESVVTMENRIYAKELYSKLPLNVIMTGLSDYEKEIFSLRKVDELSIKQVAETVGRDICQVRYDLQKIEARIRYRVRKLIGEGKSGEDSFAAKI
jgi:RNA polymerase sigma-70 factor (ECF subfamily)